MLIHLGYDIRTGFDWEAFRACQAEYSRNGYTTRFHQLKKKYVSAADPKLVRLWAELRKQCKSAGLGRSELLPIFKKGEAVSQYVGKYIAKGSPHRTGAWKGARLVSYSHRSPKRASSRFSWVKGGKPFREWAAEVSAFLDVTHETIADEFGQTWAWKLLQAKEAGMNAKQTAAYLAMTRQLGAK